MKRADFWCRVLGWLQIAGSVVVAVSILVLWHLLFGWLKIDDGGFFTFVVWVFILVCALPAFVAGLLTVLFANRVEQSQAGATGGNHVLLRIFMALSGLWTAGVVGFVGVSLPHLGFFAVLGLITCGIGIMGADWTAGLSGQAEQKT